MGKNEKLRYGALVPLLFVVASAGAWVHEFPSRAISPQAPSGALVEGTPVASLDFGMNGGLITIPVRINGSRELRLYLDTGMSAPIVVLFHRETAAEIGLKEAGKVEIGGAGGGAPKQASMATGATVEAGGLRLADQTVITLDEGRDGSLWPVDGIVGKSFFDRYVAEIDFEGSRLSFHDPARAKVREGAASIPIDLANGYPVFEAAVRIRGEGEALPLRMVMDIGHRNALSLNQDAAKGVLPPERTIETIGGRGLQGKVPAAVGRVDRLDLGGFAVTGLPTAFHGEKANPGVPRNVAVGNVGSLVWSRFRIVIDYPGKKVSLAPNSRFGKPFPFNQAGLVLGQDREDVYLVSHVVAGSPAADADLREGDRILAADGRDLRSIPYWDVLDVFAAVSGTLALSVERGGTRLEKTLSLRRLL